MHERPNPRSQGRRLVAGILEAPFYWLAASHPERPDFVFGSTAEGRPRHYHWTSVDQPIRPLASESGPILGPTALHAGGDRLAFARDHGGDENHRLFSLDLSSGREAPCSAAPIGRVMSLFWDGDALVAVGNDERCVYARRYGSDGSVRALMEGQEQMIHADIDPGRRRLAVTVGTTSWTGMPSLRE